MTSTIIPSSTTDSELDIYLIPNEIYNETINREKYKIENYFILHPHLLQSFVGFNGALKLANQLSSDKKCGCFYKMPWYTYYDHINNIKKTTLTFAQQVQEYRYMIRYWLPSPEISNLQYLSQIALGMILEISQFRYYLSNNLNSCLLCTKRYYTDNFKNMRSFIVYLNKHFIIDYKKKSLEMLAGK
jgi:hypothetical protein